MSNKKELSPAQVEKIAHRFSILSEPVRLMLLQELLKKEQCVNDLVVAMGCSQANVSRHLSLLYQEGLLSRRKQGTTVYYSIGDPSVADLCKIVCARIA